MMALPSFRAAGIARGVGGAATRQTKTQTNGPTPADRSVIRAIGMTQWKPHARSKRTAIRSVWMVDDRSR